MVLRALLLGAASSTRTAFAIATQALDRRRFMAVVIPFTPRRRSQFRACPFPRRSADILFFTGVRYERGPEARPLEAKPAIARRPRKAQPRKAHRQPA